MKKTLLILTAVALSACQNNPNLPKAKATSLPAVTAQAAPSKTPTTPPGQAFPIKLEKGQKLPAFQALDSEGKDHTLEDLRGKNGTLLVVFRSADW